MADEPVSNDEVILEAARSIRPYLGDLLGPAAVTVDVELAELLAAAATSPVDDRILRRLRANRATLNWTAAFLELGLPPDAAPPPERYAGLLGRGEAVPATRFTCPVGDFSWYRRLASQLPPKCPTHPDLTLREIPRAS